MTDSQKLDFLLQKMNQIDTKVDKLDGRIDRLDTSMEQLDNRMEQFDTRMEQLDSRATKIELHLENETDKNIQLLAENHIELINKLNQAIPIADKNLVYEVKVNHLIGEVNKLKEDVEILKKKSA